MDSLRVCGGNITTYRQLNDKTRHGQFISHRQPSARVLKATSSSGWRTKSSSIRHTSHLRSPVAHAVTAPVSESAEQLSLVDMAPKPVLERLDMMLPQYNADASIVDLLVVGAGPAGLSVAQQVAARGLSVVCVDPTPDSVWPNNYGVWVDEFEALGLADCLDYVWPRATVYLNTNEEKQLDRPYGRVNRRVLKTKVASKCVAEGVKFHTAKVRHKTTGILECFQMPQPCMDTPLVKESLNGNAQDRLLTPSVPFTSNLMARLTACNMTTTAQWLHVAMARRSARRWCWTPLGTRRG